MKMKLIRNAALVAIGSLALLAGCVKTPLKSLRSVEKRYPDAQIVQIENYAQLMTGPSRWIVKTQEGKLRIVWCSDAGNVTHEQEVVFR